MKRFPLVGILLLLPALALFVAVGCDKAGTKDKDGKPADGTKDQGKDKGADKKEPLKVGDATFKGTVKFKGTPPETKMEGGIEKMTDAKEKALCLAGEKANPHYVHDQLWFVDKSGGVANGPIPNFIYRWTEREVEKTLVESATREKPVM